MQNILKLFVVALVILAGITIAHKAASEPLNAPISSQNDEGGTLLVPGQYIALEWQISSDSTSLQSNKVFSVKELELCDDFKGIKQYACHKVTLEWGYAQFSYFDKIIQKESSWNHLAQNSKSTAFGLAQFLNSTWSIKHPKTTDPQKQIDAAIDYISDRYSYPQAAWEFHIKNNWY